MTEFLTRPPVLCAAQQLSMLQRMATDLQRHVLLAEDDDCIADVVACILEDRGYSVGRVATAADCVDALSSSCFCLLILDRFLLDADGLLLLARVKHGWPTLPVLVCSASDRSEDRKAALKFGADDFIGKPFDLDDFEARVDRVVRERGLLTAEPAEARPDAYRSVCSTSVSH